MAEDDYVSEARAVYDASTDRYVDFVGVEISEVTEGPIDRSLLAAFVEVVTTGPNLRVADVGCGPGRVAALLARQGLDVIGVDVSLAMVATARRAHPELNFELGRLDELPIADGALAGLVSWYSIIYTPPSQLHGVFAEMRRVLDTGGFVLLAFQAGAGEPIRRTDVHGTGLPLTSYRHELTDITGRLAGAGLDVRFTAQREPELDHESSPQAFVIACRP